MIFNISSLHLVNVLFLIWKMATTNDPWLLLTILIDKIENVGDIQR